MTGLTSQGWWLPCFLFRMTLNVPTNKKFLLCYMYIIYILDKFLHLSTCDYMCIKYSYPYARKISHNIQFIYVYTLFLMNTGLRS